VEEEGGEVMAVNIHLGCSLEAMKSMKDNHYDLAVVDPPYGLNLNLKTQSGGSVLASKTMYKQKGWDTEIPNNLYFDELFRVSKNQVIWGANHFMDKIAKGSPCWIVWDKMNGKNHFADCELAWTSFSSAVRQFRFRWQGMLQGDMKDKEKRIHPTQKPVALYHWIYEKYASPGMKILDTHLGSGSSAIAAWDCGLDFDGWELDEEYHGLAVSRFQQHSRQIKLF
jgi:site-specific DNA-methyltransferase (adenine-specific)